VTPTEIIAALEYGIETVKFFPCSNYGGLGTIKALAAAFPAVTFVPTGGISEENVNEYLAFPKIVACGGSWMMKGTPDEIREKTARAMAVVNG
jgi:2-dehydro-3-deoxyphosphogluconate aldolase/(4S)-4-hydroxy-2-oxoglutarate aldolase